VEKKPLAILSAGGTGGHMFPAQALAEELLVRGWEVKLSTDLRGARFTKNFPESVKIETVSSATFAKHGLISKLKVPFLILWGVFATLKAFSKHRPSIIVGFGGYPTIPALIASIFMSLPRIIHEQNGILGKVNQLFSKKVNLVACGTWPTIIPKNIRYEHIGNPVRKEVMRRSGSPYIPPGNHPMSILIMGGSQGARILSSIVPEAICTLPDELLKYIRVFQQAREEDCQRVKAYYFEKGIACEVLPFFDNIASHLSEAQLIISRSGASSVADIGVVGRPSILIPLGSATRDEQTLNAGPLKKLRAAKVIAEQNLTVKRLNKAILKILSSPENASKMAVNAHKTVVLDATKKLADRVEEISGYSNR
jgi:UDP-N-acetylglucosamine--N-acetylmuramyl-(pentapeptide) pyrophosphoryl-undecaprenol N-acetylglucosamine transferase